MAGVTSAGIRWETRSPEAPLSTLSPKQYAAIQRTDHRINVWDGAIRSGKTLSSVIAWLDYCRYGPPGPLAMIGKTHQALSRNVLDVIDELHPRAIRYTRGAPTARIMGRLVHIFGAANAAAEGRIRGLTLAGAYIDEATLVSKEFFQQVLGRMSVPGARLFATTNPDSPRHWLMQDYLMREAELDLKRWIFQLSDNPSLTTEYIRDISREFTGLFRRRMILGEWTAAEGAIYPEWDESTMTCTTAQLPVIERVFAAGLDYGQTHKTRGYLIGMGRVVHGPNGLPLWDAEPTLNDPRVHPVMFVLDEFAPGDRTVGQYVDEFLGWLRDQPTFERRHPEWLPIDPAAKVFRREMLERGVSTMAAHNNVLNGIQVIGSLIANRRLIVVRDRVTHLLDGLPNYVWDGKAAERGVTQPVKANDDEVDALRYAIYSTLRSWRPFLPLSLLADDAELEAA